VGRYDYLPFGEEAPGSSAVPEGLKFAGKEREATTALGSTTALDYFGARYYAGGVGRFTTVDPVMNIKTALADPQRWNRFAYAGNNPMRYVDPDGADFKDFVNGIADAMRANFALGMGRTTGGNPDFVVGQRVGDLISLTGSAIETIGGLGTFGSGAVLCGSGVGCLAGAPAMAAAATLSAHGVGMGVAAGVSLMAAANDSGSGSGPLSNADARKQASDLGFKETKDAPFNSHGKPVFKKGDFFITPDRDMHKGGVWKMFDRSGNRIGTYNADLTERIAK
jgi:RHS repeat-associated protein